MPTYEYECSSCKSVKDAIRKIDDRKNGPECCGQVMGQRITAPMVAPIILGAGTYQGYLCPMTNEYVTSRKRRKEIMKEHRVVETGDGA